MPTSPSAPPLELPHAMLDLAARTPLIVFSHRRWGVVTHRPQPLLERLALQFDVYVVEEPVFADAEAALMSATHQGGIEVLTPRTKEFASGFHDSQVAAIRPLLADFMASRGLRDPIVWLTTPMALPLAVDLEPRTLVYDCIEDLAASRSAPPQLAAREAALMDLADVVLAGGPSLYEARRGRHPNLHCLPSAVDPALFAPENLDGDDVEAAVATALHRGLRCPRLGFFGVIDERLDLELVAGLADRRPGWQLVMVGPVARLDPATLPQRANIHWAGRQRHEALPHLMSHWDVCLLPYALNEATRRASPAQTPEYLAGGKPVVSTPIRDVVSLYGAAVHVGKDADQFVAAVEDILDEPAPAGAARRAAARALVAAHTWDDAASFVARLLLDDVAPGRAAPIMLHDRRTAAVRPAEPDATPPPVPVPADRVDLPARPLPL